ncbi:hypothetical protein GMMP15_1130009 [Candidatus Magnetomoraceae bacterium gMMP-15]
MQIICLLPIIFIIIAIFFFLPVIRLRFTYRQPAKVNFVLVNSEKIPNEVMNFFNKTANTLDKEYFMTVMDITHAGEGSRPSKYIRYFVNRKEGHSAIAVSMYKDAKLSYSYIEFRSVFSSWGEIRYKIVFTGYIADGMNSSEVKKRLSTLFKQNVTSMERFLIGKQFESKPNLDRDKAYRFKTKIEKTGAMCRVEKVELTKQKPEIDEILTTNYKQAFVFKETDRKKIINFPDVINARKLYKLHHKQAAKIGKNAQNILPSVGEEIAYLSDMMTQEMKSHVKNGYFFFHNQSDMYLPTWKGAFILTWGLWWFISGRRKKKK